MARHLVCLTVDFDGMSSWIRRGMTTPTPLSRGEFSLVGTQRLLSLFQQHDILSTWFTPGHTIEMYPELCARIHEEGHEIGNHGYMHEPPATLSREEEDLALARGNEAIRRITGAYPRGYRSPSWDLSVNSVELLLQHGFVYDSSMMADDYTPYRIRQGDVIHPDRKPQLGKGTRLIEMPISYEADDSPNFQWLRTPSHLNQGLRRAGAVLENWVDDFRYMARVVDWGVLTYTLHPHISGRGHRMLMLERLIETLKEMGATFVRLDAAAAEFAERSPF